MYQQTYCLTLPKPFFKIFLFRIYAPTIHSTDIDFDETSVSGLHTSPRQSSHHKPIHQRHSPPNLHVHTTHKPIHQRHCPQPHTPQIHTPQIPRQYSLHKHIQPPQTQTPTHRHIRRRAAPDVVDALDADVDADTQTLLQHRCSRSPIPVRNWTGQADRIRLKTRQDRIRPKTDQARPIRPNQRTGIRQP